MPDLDTGTAQGWIDRWDAQQTHYLPDREDRFTALIDAVEAGAGRPDPLVIDLGCGPGSLAVRLLDRMPDATVIAIDTDPVLLALGRVGYGGRGGLRFADLDLRTPGWAGSLGLDRPADAAVSTTALHWLRAQELRACTPSWPRCCGPAACCSTATTSRRTRRSNAGAGPDRPGADRARGTAALRRRAPRELDRLVAGGHRRSGAGRPGRGAAAAAAEREPSRSASRCCLARISMPCARLVSTRSGQSGSAARTASCAPFSADRREPAFS